VDIVITPAHVERFWAKVNKTETCWLWTGCDNGKGYGQTFPGGRTTYAHRYSYVLHNGQIPAGMVIDHKCFNRRCVNPEHLRAVTTKQNLENQQGARKGSSSGVRGVTWHKLYNKWMAQTTHHNKPVYVGYYLTIAEAEQAIIAKRRELFTHSDMDLVAA
jgi:hypothetical protein